MRVFVKVKSHRARGKLTSLLGFSPNEYFKFGSDYITAIPSEFLTQALQIKSITKAKWDNGYSLCRTSKPEWDYIEKGA